MVANTPLGGLGDLFSRIPVFVGDLAAERLVLPVSGGFHAFGAVPGTISGWLAVLSRRLAAGCGSSGRVEAGSGVAAGF